MYQKSGSKAWRWLAAGLLAVSAIPIGMAWRSAGSGASGAPKPLDWAEVNGQAWSDPSEIEVQLKPGEGDDVLADLGKKIGTPLTFESPAARAGSDSAPAQAAQRLFLEDLAVASASTPAIWLRIPCPFPNASPVG